MDEKIKKELLEGLDEYVFRKKLRWNEIFLVISPKITVYVSSRTVRTSYYQWIS